MVGQRVQEQDIKNAIAKAGLTVPDKHLLDARYVSGINDWYVRTDAGWLWWDDRKRLWTPTTSQD